VKAICIADAHGDVKAVTRLRNTIETEDLDYVFILGDFSKGFKDPEENRVDIGRILDVFSDFSVKAIPGNCDQRNSTDIFDKRGVNLHNTVLRLPEASIIGFGGSNTTPFNTPFEYNEDDIRKSLDSLYAQAEKGSKVIVMTHAPPKDTNCDKIQSGLHVGSTGLRGFIEERKPALVLCSHIHESGGHEDHIGPTRILNVGRVSEGRAYMLEVTDAVSLEFYS